MDEKKMVMVAAEAAAEIIREVGDAAQRGQFTRWQALNWDYSGRLQRAQTDVTDVRADLGFRLPAD